MLFKIKTKINSGMPLHLCLALCLALGLALCIALPTSSQSKEYYNYSLALGYAPQTLSGGESGKTSPYFVVSPGLTASVGRTLNSHLRFKLDFFSTTIYSDSQATSSLQLGSNTEDRISGFRSKRLTVAVQYFPFENKHTINPSAGVGIGIDSWEFRDPITDSTLDTLGDRNIPTKFEAEELVLTTFAGVDVALTNQLALSFEGRAAYLAGPGAEFDDLANSSRPRWAYSLSTKLEFNFGASQKPEKWNSEKNWSQKSPTTRTKPRNNARDSDGDGVSDELDKCPSTAAGAIVNSLGCPMDTDGDGVYDGLDDCPATPAGALGAVDIHGCPIDSDFDGVPDYTDACPAGPVGAHVDQSGCPTDGDQDGIADGLDDCPQTTEGLKVDERGCVDMSMFAQALVLNISYQSGSYEVDKNAKSELRQLALMLNAAASIQLEIIGYTDNIGAALVNKTLSEKRARRVRDYLIKLGIASERMKVRGRGETNFIADNSTAKGRQKNRRIEILFQRN